MNADAAERRFVMARKLTRRAFITAGTVGAGGVATIAPVFGTPAFGAPGFGRVVSAAPVAEGGLVALRTPVRVFDSRNRGAPLNGNKLASGQSVAVTVSSAFGDIPSGFANLVFVNCTITGTEGSGYLVVRGSDLTGDLPLPNTSNINWSGPNQTLANLVLTTVGGENALEVHCDGGGRTHVIVDVQGYVPFII
jgi:hypothetical protein